MAGLQAGATSLAFSPDGASLAAGCDDGSIAVWDLGSAQAQAQLAGHTSAVHTLAWSHGSGTVLASGGADCTVRLWSAPLCERPAARRAAPRPAPTRPDLT
jgi:transcription initiation factor TFIID subunit 5